MLNKLLRTEHVQGGQAPLENQANVPPPKYVFARRNCWPGYLPKPKRLARDSIPTCDCHPSDSGLQSLRTGSKPHPVFYRPCRRPARHMYIL